MFSAPYSLFIKFDIRNPYKSAASAAYVLFFCAKFKLLNNCRFPSFSTWQFYVKNIITNYPLTELLLSVAMAMRMYRRSYFAFRASFITKCPQF